MPAFRPRHLTNKDPIKQTQKSPNIDAIEDFPDLCGKKKEITPVKSWANLIKDDEKDELFNPVLKTKPIVDNYHIDYFENDIDNIFDIQYGDMCYDISDKIQDFCYSNALPLYNTRSKINNLIEFVKNTSTALDNIIEDYDKEDEEEIEEFDDEIYESDISNED